MSRSQVRKLHIVTQGCQMNEYDSARMRDLLGASDSLIATEDPQYLDEATEVLKAAVNKDNRNPFAWYQLGVVYSQQGDIARAQLATAESSLLERNYAGAIRSSQIAMGGIPENTPDWIRAQDISFIAKAEFEKNNRRR